MKTFFVYLTWLNEIKEKAIDEKTKQSIQILINQLIVLEEKRCLKKTIPEYCRV
jgi:hypothetical protein